MNSTGSPASESELRGSIQHHLQQGRLSEALRATEALVKLAPDDVNARLWLSKLQIDRGQWLAAAATLQETVLRLPDDAVLIGETARQLFSAGETLLARECLEHAEIQRTTSAQALILASRIRHMLGEPDRALPMLERALEAGADAPQHHHFHGMLLQFVGRIEDAERTLDACLQRWPSFGEAALTRSRLHRQTPAKNHLDDLSAQIPRAAPGSLTRASFLFAQYKELDDLGRHEEAWPALEAANAIMRTLHPYDERDDERLLEATMKRCDRAFFEASPPACKHDGPRPIFIVGLPRSGTTLLDRMLSNHSRITSAGEIPDFLHQWRRAFVTGGSGTDDFLEAIRHADDAERLALVGRNYLRQTAWRAHDAPFFVDKMPNNLPLAGFIRKALPQAHIVLIQRDPMATCFSNYRAMFGTGSAHSYDLRTLGRYHRRHARLEEHWKQTLGKHMHVVRYADLVKHPRDAMENVLAFCGLDLEEGCLQPSHNQAPVSTPSSAQVREPIHARGLDDWQHYAEHLSPLREAMNGPER